MSVWEQRQYDATLDGRPASQGRERRPSVAARSIWEALYCSYFNSEMPRMSCLNFNLQNYLLFFLKIIDVYYQLWDYALNITAVSMRIKERRDWLIITPSRNQGSSGVKIRDAVTG